MSDDILLTIAVVGGTGQEGSGLAMRWVRSGYRVVIGSRAEMRAKERAAELNEILSERGLILGEENGKAVRQADVVVLTVPYAAQKETLASIQSELRGKILVTVVVPIQPDRPTQAMVPEGGSAALEAQAQLGDAVRVVSAFQNVSAVALRDPDRSVDCDILVCGDDAEAKVAAIRMAEAAGMTAYDAGPLKNSLIVEGLTPILIGINKRYQSHQAGFRITGVSR